MNTPSTTSARAPQRDTHRGQNVRTSLAAVISSPITCHVAVDALLRPLVDPQPAQHSRLFLDVPQGRRRAPDLFRNWCRNGCYGCASTGTSAGRRAGVVL